MKTRKKIYLIYALTPKVENEGEKFTFSSIVVNNLINGSRRKPISTQQKACNPNVLENISIVIPKTKDKIRVSQRLVFTGKANMNNIYI